MSVEYTHHQQVLDTYPWWSPLYDECCRLTTFDDGSSLLTGPLLRIISDADFIDYDWLYGFYLCEYTNIMLDKEYDYLRSYKIDTFYKLKHFAHRIFAFVAMSPREFGRFVPPYILRDLSISV